jgi:prevent-host-death family protein
MNATAKDLRLHSHELLQTAAQGEEVIISYHGKPLAKLVPLGSSGPKEKKAHSAGFGMWKARKDMQDVAAYVRQLRQGRQL